MGPYLFFRGRVDSVCIYTALRTVIDHRSGFDDSFPFDTYVLHICRDLFCGTLVKFEFFDQQFSCLSHLLLDIANEISIAVIEVKHCPTLGCFGQYSDFYFPLAWENMQLKIQNVPTIQAINGALFKPFSVKPFLLVYFYISFY